MTDKIHENWRKQGIPTWKSAMTPQSTGKQIVLMQQEIDALRQRVQELEADAKRYRLIRCPNITDRHHDRIVYAVTEYAGNKLDQLIDAEMYKNGEEVDTSEPTCIDIGGHPV